MEYTDELLSIIVGELYGTGCTFKSDDNGDQIVVNAEFVDDIATYYFNFVLYKVPFKITVNDKNIPSVKIKTIKKLINYEKQKN